MNACVLCGHELNPKQQHCSECSHDQRVSLTTGLPLKPEEKAS